MPSIVSQCNPRNQLIVYDSVAFPSFLACFIKLQLFDAQLRQIEIGIIHDCSGHGIVSYSYFLWVPDPIQSQCYLRTAINIKTGQVALYSMLVIHCWNCWVSWLPESSMGSCGQQQLFWVRYNTVHEPRPSVSDICAYSWPEIIKIMMLQRSSNSRSSNTRQSFRLAL